MKKIKEAIVEGVMGLCALLLIGGSGVLLAIIATIMLALPFMIYGALFLCLWKLIEFLSGL